MENIKIIDISNLRVGDLIVNLGLVLGFDRGNDRYSVVIERMNQAQVIRFYKNIKIYVFSTIE